MKKKIFITTLFVLLLAIGIATPAAAEKPDTPPQLNYVDAQLGVFLSRLDTFQAEYHNGHGQYFQALQSHSEVPDGLAESDTLDLSPSDQDASLATLWNYAAMPAKIDWSFRVDTYAAPDGEGYVITVLANVKDETWTRAVALGPETWRGYDWRLAVVDVIE